jgi:bacterioferritin-associated ferredoxin
MSHEQNPPDHIPDKKLREVAASSLEELPSIFIAEEAAHFGECGKCIDALANIARELSRENNPEKKKKAS